MDKPVEKKKKRPSHVNGKVKPAVWAVNKKTRSQKILDKEDSERHEAEEVKRGKARNAGR